MMAELMVGSSSEREEEAVETGRSTKALARLDNGPHEQVVSVGKVSFPRIRGIPQNALASPMSQWFSASLSKVLLTSPEIQSTMIGNLTSRRKAFCFANQGKLFVPEHVAATRSSVFFVLFEIRRC